MATTSVAHYTRIGTLGYFIPEGASGWASAWATPVQFLNDRMELSLGLEVLRDVADGTSRSGRNAQSIIDQPRSTSWLVMPRKRGNN